MASKVGVQGRKAPKPARKGPRVRPPRKPAKVVFEIRSIGVRAPNSLAVAEQVRQGLPVEAFAKALDFTDLPTEAVLKATSISERTLARRRREGRFDPLESERVVRLGRILDKVDELFEGDRRAARRWIREPHRALDDKTPLELMETEPGAREVEALIGRLEHGVFS